MEGVRLVALRRTGAEWVVTVDVMAMAMNGCVWSEERDEGLQPSGGLSGRPEQETPPPARHCKTPYRGPPWGLGDGPVAAFDQAGAGDGCGGEGEGEVGGFCFGEA